MVVSLHLTRLGKLALAKSLTGMELHFTCIKIGSGDFDYETESVYDMEDLRHYELTLPFAEVSCRGDGDVYQKRRKTPPFRAGDISRKKVSA